MKALRIFGLVLATIIVLVVVLALLALTPAGQTWAVKKAAASQPGMKLDVSRVSAGLSNADLRDVHLVKDGMVVTAKHVVAKYSAMDYLTKKRLTVQDFTVEDLTVDARGASATGGTAGQHPGAENRADASHPATAESGQPFNGVLSGIQLPVDLNIARFAVPGRVLLPQDQTLTFEVHGSDLISGQRGTIDFKADLANAQPGAALTALHAGGTAEVHITTERRIDLAQLNAVVQAEGPKLPQDELKLVAKAEQPAAGGNEGYNATISLVRGGNAEQLASFVGQYRADAHDVAGVWSVSVRNEQLSALLGGLGLPDFAAEGNGKFASKPDVKEASFSGEIRSSISHLEKSSPQLASLGTVNLQMTFDGGLANDVAQLSQLAIDATGANGQKLVQIQSLQRVGFSLADKKVSFENAKADLARVTVEALPLAYAQPFARDLAIESGTVSMVLAVAADADGSRVRVTPVQPLTFRDVTVRRGEQTLADHMNLSVKPTAEYGSDKLHAELAELTMTANTGDSVNGRFTADVTNVSKNPTVAFTTDTQAKFVAMLKPYLKADTGPLTVVSKSSGSLAGQTLSFQSSSTKVTRADGTVLLAADLAQPLTFNLQDSSIAGSNANADSLRLQLTDLPLAWAQAFVPDSTLSGSIASGTIGVRVRSLNDLTAATTQPILVRGASVTMNGEPLLSSVDVSTDFTADKAGDTVRFNVRKVEAKQRNAVLLSLTAQGDARLAGKPVLNAKGTLDCDITALMQQPVMAKSAMLSRGSLHATFDAALGDSLQASINLVARDLVAKQDNRPLGTAELTATATVQADGSSVVHVPFTLSNGPRKSDLTLDGKVARAGDVLNFDGKVVSQHLFVDDVKPLASLAPSTPAADKAKAAKQAAPTPRGATASTTRAPASPTTMPPSPTTGTADAKAFWSGVTGKVDLDLKEITYGTDYIISGVHGTAAITPEELSLSSLEGQLKGNPFKVATAVKFTPAQPKPYTLDGLIDVTGFDVGEFLKASTPNEAPILETRLAINGKLNGSGTSALDLGKNVFGTFDVTGTQGVLRALANRGGQLLGAASQIAGIVGNITGDQKTAAIAELAGQFAEMKFDRLNMHVERAADLNLKITQLEFLAQEFHLTGTGAIENQPNVPVDKQPMKLVLSLGAKSGLEQLLQKYTHVLSDQHDALGFATMSKSFTIGGSASKPDSSGFWSQILAEMGGVGGAVNTLQDIFKRR
jgi:hypothetical protein